MLHSALWPHSISHWDSVVEEVLSLHGTWKGRSMGIKTMRGVEKEKRWERDSKRGGGDGSVQALKMSIGFGDMLGPGSEQPHRQRMNT